MVIKFSKKVAILVFLSVFTIVLVILGILVTNTKVIYILNDEEMGCLADVAYHSYENDFSVNLEKDEIRNILSDKKITDEMKNVLTNPESYAIRCTKGIITVELKDLTYIGSVTLDTSNNIGITFDDGKGKIVIIIVCAGVFVGEIAIIIYILFIDIINRKKI